MVLSFKVYDHHHHHHFIVNKGMTERKPTNDKLIIETNNSYDITYGLKNYSQKDVWSEQVAEKSVYAV